MRTLYLRIIVTFTLTLLGSSVVMLLISAHLSRLAIGDLFEGSMKLQLRAAERIYETRGAQALADYLSENDAALKGKRYLTDAAGRDLVSGVDRSRMITMEFDFLGMPKKRDGQVAISRTSDDGRYHLVVVAPPPVALSRFAPYFLLLAAAITLLGWVLSAGIISPLRRVASAVDRFGRGDLSARVASDRRDEIGDLARSFNSMAERIQTLLTAERRLLQDVSHELRSPLARLSFAAELIKDTPDPEAATQRIRREIGRLTRLVASLLEVTSAEGDPSTRKSERLAVPALIEEIASDCGVEAEARDVRIETEIGAPAVVEGDPELLRRAIENVLRNAIRFAPENSSVLVQVEADAGKVAINVRDQGPGVPGAMLKRIFDPFHRVAESRGGDAGGVGLGLSIARRAVLLHHGEITAENASPGLRVKIIIPAVS